MHTTTTDAGRAGTTARRRAVGTALAALALLAVSCTADRDPLGPRIELQTADVITRLRAAPDCPALVDAARPAMLDTVASWWTEGDSWSGDDEMVAADGAAASRSGEGPATTTAAAAPAAEQGTADASTTGGARTVVGTNNQEAAVDESDMVKTDGRRLISIVDGVLRVVELDGDPGIDGSLDLRTRGATELFLRGDQALVLGTSYGTPAYGGAVDGGDVVVPEAVPSSEDPAVPTSTTSTTSTAPPSTTSTTSTTTASTTTASTTTTTSSTSTTVPTTTVPVAPPPFAVATTLTMVSLDGPGAPTVTASADLEGTLVTAREQDGRARIVVQSSPMAVERLTTSASRDEALAVVDQLDVPQLLPRMTVDGRVTAVGSCQDVLVPTDAASLPDGRWSGMPSTVTVLTVGDDLVDLQPVSIQSVAETVYASTASLFVASPSWDQSGSRTDVHRFSLAGEGPATYTGSGRAPGHLLNQFSLSERDGALRMVTTLDGTGVPMPIEPGIGDVMSMESQSAARLTVLDTDGTLDEIGHLDGMGIGEQVQSVRFMDDRAYLVTFRQVDPLYALDLSDPRAPRLLGELKIPGFSEYLHPVGEGLLLGVGRQVDPGTGIDEGLKISLFDVSDPSAMSEVDQIVLPGAWSEVSNDHRAFLWDPSRRQAVIPAEFSGCGATGRCTQDPGGAALVVRADPSGLDEIGRFAHEPVTGWSLQPNRAVVVDDDLWTVSVAAIGRTDADAPTSVELVAF